MDSKTDKLISYDALLKDIQNTITENSTFLDWMNLIYRQPSVVLENALDDKGFPGKSNFFTRPSKQQCVLETSETSVYSQIRKRFSRYLYCYRHKDYFNTMPSLYLKNYKGYPAIKYVNFINDTSFYAYIKEDLLEIDDEKGESFYSHAEEYGWTEKDVYLIRHGVALYEHGDNTLEDSLELD